MLRLLPRLALEPPPAYVAFVERHLQPLRRDAARVVGAARDAGELYPEVLTDVAVRWGWLELLHTRLGRPGAADLYLNRAFRRRSQQWRNDQVEQVPIEVWHPHAPPPVRSNVAVRLAPFVRRTHEAEVGAVAEAAIAWCHAYEARRRRRVLAGLVALFLFAVLLAQARHALEPVGSAWSG